MFPFDVSVLFDDLYLDNGDAYVLRAWVHVISSDDWKVTDLQVSYTLPTSYEYVRSHSPDWASHYALVESEVGKERIEAAIIEKMKKLRDLAAFDAADHRHAARHKRELEGVGL